MQIHIITYMNTQLNNKPSKRINNYINKYATNYNKTNYIVICCIVIMQQCNYAIPLFAGLYHIV